MKISLKHLDTFIDRHGARRYYVRINKIRYPLPSPGDGEEPSKEFLDQYYDILRYPPMGGERVKKVARRGTQKERKPTGMIYVVGYDRFVKIGFTNQRLTERLRTLSTGSPVELTVYFTFPAWQFEETQFHRRFSAYRLRGEWFELRGALLEWFDERRGILSPTSNPISKVGSL